MNNGYSELLKNRKWKTKRKRIIFRDGDKCTVCGNKENLCAHHTYYYKIKVKPWDYPDDALITLCEKCHNEWHTHNKNVHIDNPDKPRVKKRIKKKRVKSKKKRNVGYKGPSLARTQERSYTNKYRKKINGEWVVIEKHKD